MAQVKYQYVNSINSTKTIIVCSISVLEGMANLDAKVRCMLQLFNVAMMLALVWTKLVLSSHFGHEATTLNVNLKNFAIPYACCY